MATPEQQYAQQPAMSSRPGPISEADLAEWKARFGDLLARPGEHVKSRSPEGAQPWKTSFFEFWSPLSTCLTACYVPCIVFGRTHHRLRKSPTLEGYDPVNTSCLLMGAAGCLGLHWIPVAMQRADLRAKHNLGGSCLVDIATACCCGCCSVIQQDKEAEYRELAAGGSVQQAYQAPGAMAYPADQKQ